MTHGHEWNEEEADVGRRAAREISHSVVVVLNPSGQALINADITALPFRDGTFDVVLAAHMLYHVPDRPAAVRELRRVLAPGGVCIAVTNGARHLRSLRGLVERSVRTAAPDWQMRSATHAFTAE